MGPYLRSGASMPIATAYLAYHTRTIYFITKEPPRKSAPQPRQFRHSASVCTVLVSPGGHAPSGNSAEVAATAHSPSHGGVGRAAPAARCSPRQRSAVHNQRECTGWRAESKVRVVRWQHGARAPTETSPRSDGEMWELPLQKTISVHRGLGTG